MKNATIAVLLAGIVTVSSCGADEPDTRAAVDAFEQKLEIAFDGGTIAIPVETMEVWLTDSPSRSESFEISGEGVSIVGAFPKDLRVDYAENWHVLVGRPVPISSRGGDPDFDRPSILTVPGVGQYRVIGGTLTVDSVAAGWNGQTPLTGRIELRVRAATGEVSLNGTFAVKAMTWG